MRVRRLTWSTLLSASALMMPLSAGAVEFTCWDPGGVGSANAAAEYWTPERIAAAIPEREMIGTLPTDGFPSDGEGILVGDAERAPIGEAPYKFGGQLLYTRGGDDYTASAQFVADANIVIGAAHSLWKGGMAASNIRFYQGYSNGGGTLYHVDRAAVLLRWTEVADNDPSLARSQFDYSVMRTTVASAVGKYELGIDGAHVDENVTVTGYPARLDDGEYMYRETARIVVQAGTSYDARPHPMYGGGASGGAWFVTANNVHKAVSVVSSGAPDGVFGPSFSADTADLIAIVKNGCP
ncbi:hypothetical protein [Neorhizobium galegae]|uniref:hypothetical protein n=1 Tax=Neorhizobium galegae TaxID=399 RepID=UPI002101D7AC|nr:hypothetical protein [Neorhizobium galegae]MCQ1833663.1 hypothetical protein [Neorhizobium galegae]UIY30532.1 hypothetical protein LZK73_08250 [Neorhizobium galegae]